MLKSQYGYIPLSVKKIFTFLNMDLHALIDKIQVFDEIESTNKTISTFALSSNYSILLAESQTGGYGRRQKKWVSPVGKNIYLSIQFRLRNSMNLNLLPLLTAISLCKSLNNLGIEGCQIKWPNDIFINGKKLGGILVESRYNSEQEYRVIVGIGLNVNMTSSSDIDQLWTSLCLAENKLFDRNKIISALLSDLIVKLSAINSINKRQFMLDWTALDYLKGKKVIIMEDSSSYSATSLGLSDDGSLRVEVLDGNTKIIKNVYSGDVSIKSNRE